MPRSRPWQHRVFVHPCRAGALSASMPTTAALQCLPHPVSVRDPFREERLHRPCSEARRRPELMDVCEQVPDLGIWRDGGLGMTNASGPARRCVSIGDGTLSSSHMFLFSCLSPAQRPPRVRRSPQVESPSLAAGQRGTRRSVKPARVPQAHRRPIRHSCTSRTAAPSRAQQHPSSHSTSIAGPIFVSAAAALGADLDSR